MAENTRSKAGAPKRNDCGAKETRQLLADHVAAAAPVELIALLQTGAGPTVNVPIFVAGMWRGFEESGALAIMASVRQDIDRKLEGIKRHGR